GRVQLKGVVLQQVMVLDGPVTAEREVIYLLTQHLFQERRPSVSGRRRYAVSLGVANGNHLRSSRYSLVPEPPCIMPGRCGSYPVPQHGITFHLRQQIVYRIKEDSADRLGSEHR